jgi:hypothetical protein
MAFLAQKWLNFGQKWAKKLNITQTKNACQG